MMRQFSKQILTLRAFLVFWQCKTYKTRPNGGVCRVLAAVLAGIMLISPVGSAYANSGRLVLEVVVDPLSGVALNGFDAISYFTEDEPQMGSADFELYWNGVPWYFASEGNLEIFSKAPYVYAPVYGGHGAMSMARGFMSDGNPLIYKVLDKRLYLFYSFANRSAFELSDKLARVDGIRNWQNLRSGQD